MQKRKVTNPPALGRADLIAAQAMHPYKLGQRLHSSAHDRVLTYSRLALHGRQALQAGRKELYAWRRERRTAQGVSAPSR